MPSGVSQGWAGAVLAFAAVGAKSIVEKFGIRVIAAFQVGAIRLFRQLYHALQQGRKPQAGGRLCASRQFCGRRARIARASGLPQTLPAAAPVGARSSPQGSESELLVRGAQNAEHVATRIDETLDT